MFNLLIAAGEQSWELGTYEFSRGRVAIEYTADEISERYKFFDEQVIQELKSLPSLFVTEGESTESKIGYITDIRLSQSGVTIDFEFDTSFQPLKIGYIEALGHAIHLGKWELTRTHWAIKDVPLFDTLLTRGYISAEELFTTGTRKEPLSPNRAPELPGGGDYNHSQVFIVHGHNEVAKFEMESFIKQLGLEPIILHKQASEGRTIIEKIEYYSNVGFAIALYTPCDIGNKAGELAGEYRARQNVVFEHGYLIGKLGRPRVAAVIKGTVTPPNDITGVVYINMDAQENWKEELKIEMKSKGYNV